DRGVLIRAGSHPPTPQVAVVRQAHGSGTCEATGTPRSTGSGYVPVHAWNPKHETEHKVSVAVPLFSGQPVQVGRRHSTPPVTRDTDSVGGGDQTTTQPKGAPHG